MVLGNMPPTGVVHRDLKLENMIVGTDGILRIIDLGFSNFFIDDAMLVTFCGRYASRERCSAAWSELDVIAQPQLRCTGATQGQTVCWTARRHLVTGRVFVCHDVSMLSVCRSCMCRPLQLPSHHS